MCICVLLCVLKTVRHYYPYLNVLGINMPWMDGLELCKAIRRDSDLPILFLTQLVGVALGIEGETLGIGKEIVAAEPVIRAKLAPAASAGKA